MNEAAFTICGTFRNPKIKHLYMIHKCTSITTNCIMVRKIVLAFRPEDPDLASNDFFFGGSQLKHLLHNFFQQEPRLRLLFAR